MSAPTLWEEGRMSGSRVVRLTLLSGLVVLALDLSLLGRPSLVFDTAFVLICLGAALAVRPRDFFKVAVLPPLSMLFFITGLALVHRDWIADARDGLVQAVVSGLAHRASALLTAYLLALAVLALRQRVRAKRYRKRSVSPAPTRATWGGPSERSTTVVGSDPHSPESITASNH